MEDVYTRKGGTGGSSNIFPGLDNETMNALYAAEKNWNSEFKNGTLKQGLPTTPGEAASGMLNATAAAANNVAGAVDFTVHMPQFTTYVVTYVTTSITSYLADAIVDMMSIDLGRIPAYAATIMPNFLIGAGQIMQELLKTKESIMEDATKAAEQAVVDGINQKIGDNVTKLTDSVQEKLGKVQGTIQAVAYYAAMGPMWVKNKTDVETKKILETCFKEIGEKRDTVKQNVQGVVDNLGVKMAEKMAAKVNQKIKETTKESLDKINIQKQKALNKAKTAITNAKLKLMALIGG